MYVLLGRLDYIIYFPTNIIRFSYLQLYAQHLRHIVIQNHVM